MRVRPHRLCGYRSARRRWAGRPSTNARARFLNAFKAALRRAPSQPVGERGRDPQAPADRAIAQARFPEGQDLFAADWCPWTSQPLPERLGALDTCDHALANQVPLELREDREHPEQRFPGRRRGVESLVKYDEFDAEGLELFA